jgi:tetratricopeptide (TPR) repeat protein
VLRYLVEAGLVIREGDRYVRTDDGPDEGGIPEGLRDVIGKRLTRLSSQTNTLLSIAAVQGRDFRLDVLQAVAQQPAEAVEAALEEAAERAIVEERTGLGTLAFRFTHAFFRQTLYEELFAARRLRLHQEVGTGPRSSLRFPFGRPRRGAGRTLRAVDRCCRPRACARYADAAAEHALAVYAYGDAARESERALKLHEVFAPSDDVQRLKRLLTLGDALLLAGEPRRVYEEVAVQAYALAVEVDDARGAARGALLAVESLTPARGAGVWGTSEYSEWVRRAALAAPTDPNERVQVDTALSNIAWAEGRFGEAWALARSAVSVAIEADDMRALSRATTSALLRAPAAAAEEWLRLVGEAATRLRADHPGSLFDMALGFALLAAGEREAAEDVWQRLRLLADRINEPELVVRAHALEVTRAVLDGDLEGAVILAQGTVVRGAELGAPGQSRVVALMLNTAALIWLGRPEELILQLDSAYGSVQSEIFFGTVRRAAAAAHARHADAAQLLRTILPASAEAFAEMPISGPDWILDAALTLGDRDAARALAVALTPTAGLAFLMFIGPSPARLLGEEALSRGATAEARAFFERAIDVTSQIRFRPEIALSRLGLAEVLLGNYPDERAEALEHLDFAIEELRAMKMQPSLERALRSRDLLKA